MSLTHLAEPAMLATLLEAGMLICFGVAWPLATLRMIRSGRMEGKGTTFTFTQATHKHARSAGWC